MGSWFEQSGNGQSDNTSRLQSDKVENPKFDSHGLLAEAAGLPQLKSKGDSANNYLPPCTIHDPDSSDKPANGNNPDAQPGSDNHNNKNCSDVNGTKIGRDSSGNITSYSADGYSVAQHQDGKWYYHQDNKDGSKYVEVNNVQMNSNGEVTFHETGLFGKNGSIGGGVAQREIRRAAWLRFKVLVTQPLMPCLVIVWRTRLVTRWLMLVMPETQLLIGQPFRWIKYHRNLKIEIGS